MRLVGLLAFLVATSTELFAFSNSYVTFEHPEGWVCERVQGVWICQNSTEPDRRESVVLSIAAPATEWDTIENYEDWLKQARTVTDDEDKSYTSEVRYVRKRNINGQEWVDSLQYNSEMPGFWARYVATLHSTAKVKLAILITYIVSDEHYKQMAPQFERMISSLKLNQDFELNVASHQSDEFVAGANMLGPNRRNLIAERLKKPEAKPATTPGDDSGMGSVLVLLLGVGVVGFLVYRIRTRKKQSSSPPSFRKGA